MNELTKQILAGFLSFLAISLIFIGLAQPDDDSGDQALIDYYLGISGSAFAEMDIRSLNRPFRALAVIRRYTFEDNADTLRLDTALVKLLFFERNPSGPVLDTLRPDSVEILLTSYLEETPELPPLFFSPPCLSAGSYLLFEDDPAAAVIALAFEPDSSGEEVRPDGLFSLDRSNGALRYLLFYLEYSLGNSYSAEYRYGEFEGYIYPKRVREHLSKASTWGRTFHIVETEIIEIRLDPSR